MTSAQDCFVLSEGDPPVSGTRLLWWIVPHKLSGSVISLVKGDLHNEIRLTPDDSGILIMLGGELTVRTGSITIMSGDFTSLVKLQVFLDFAMKAEDNSRTDVWNQFSPYRFKKVISPKLFEKWLINQTLVKSEMSETMLSMLRSTECYWLIRFLLETQGKGSSLKELGQIYGLSVSHFRRLTKAALGKSTKEELCNWRLARALMDLMEADDKITDIALKHGYASLSHFSNDVKNVLGVPPRELKNIITSDFDL